MDEGWPECVKTHQCIARLGNGVADFIERCTMRCRQPLPWDILLQKLQHGLCNGREVRAEGAVVTQFAQHDSKLIY